MAQIILSQSTINLTSIQHLNSIHTSTFTFSEIQFNIIIPLMTLHDLLVFWHNHLGCLNFPCVCVTCCPLTVRVVTKNLSRCHVSFRHFVPHYLSRWQVCSHLTQKLGKLPPLPQQLPAAHSTYSQLCSLKTDHFLQWKVKNVHAAVTLHITKICGWTIHHFIFRRSMVKMSAHRSY
jgi:hypothetical protein